MNRLICSVSKRQSHYIMFRLYRKAPKSEDKCGERGKEFTCRNSLNPLEKRNFHCDDSREAHNRSLLIELYPNRTINIESTEKI
jgi:hypothetical protein